MAEGDARHEAVIRRETAAWERQKARAEASEENFKKTFADLMKQEEVKRALAADAQQATKDPSRRTSSRNLDTLRESFSCEGYAGGEVITGNESFPWDRDR